LQARDIREQCRKPIRQRPVIDIQAQPDWSNSGALAQVAGLSPIVSATFFVSPPLRNPSVTV
jgi:hypothetical protein